jgi:hypothetical protein
MAPGTGYAAMWPQIPIFRAKSSIWTNKYRDDIQGSLGLSYRYDIMP